MNLPELFSTLIKDLKIDHSLVTDYGATFIRFKHEGEHLELSLKVFKARKKKVKRENKDEHPNPLAYTRR